MFWKEALRAYAAMRTGAVFLLASGIYVYRDYPFRVLTTITTVGGVYVAYMWHIQHTPPIQDDM